MAGALHPHATHTADIYHAREHRHDLANHLAFITPDPPQWLAARLAELDTGNIDGIITARQYPLDGVKAEELDKSPATSSATRTGCATSTSATWACSPARAPSKAESRRSWSSAPSNQACTGPPTAPPASSPCAAHASGRWDEPWPASTTTPGQLRAAI
jgi:hypothetical protein